MIDIQNEGIKSSSDFQIGKDGRKHPAKRIHLGTKTKILGQKQMGMGESITTIDENEDHILQTLADQDINSSMKNGKVVVYDRKDVIKARLIVKKLGLNYPVIFSKINEELESLEELSKKTLDSYIDKAGKDYAERSKKGYDKFKSYAGKDSLPPLNTPETSKEGNSLLKRGNSLQRAKSKSFLKTAHPFFKDRANSEKPMKFSEYLKKTVQESVIFLDEEIPVQHFNKLIKGWIQHKKNSKKGGFKPMNFQQYHSFTKQFHPDIKEALAIMESYDVEELNELSKNALASYVVKANHDIGNKNAERSEKVRTTDNYFGTKQYNKDLDKLSNRYGGIAKAARKLAKESMEMAEEKIILDVKKPRDPNHTILMNKIKASGKHRDKKKDQKNGTLKHKNQTE